MNNLRKKIHKSKIYKNKISHLVYGNIIGFGIISKSNGILSQKHLECIRIIVNRRIRKLGGKFIIKVKPQIPITKKSLGVRMGKGKGSFKELVFYTKKDQLLFEFKHINLDMFILLYNKIKHKLPIKIDILVNKI